MKKAAIVTITNSGLNCGNRLQNYALQTVLEQYGIRAETICSAKSIGRSVLLSKLRGLLKRILRSSGRQRRFNAFDCKHVRKSPDMRYENLNESVFADRYDAFITGSDQVWNPTFAFNSDFEFLTFAPPEKRYSYAASFGVDEIPAASRAPFARYLREMRTISVREEQGRGIVRALCGRDAHVHIDPTLLLEANHYMDMVEKPSYPLPERYVLIYYLGKKRQEYLTFARAVSNILGLEVVELSEDPRTKLYHIGPQHFLYLFRNAEYICTDSFHGTIFSILFYRKFTAFFREGCDLPMNSRIETLLKKLGLQNRLFGALDAEQSLEPIAYDEVELMLEYEREQANAYLRSIIEQW